MKSELPAKQHKILVYISMNGPTTEYQLTKEKRLGLSSFVAHQATGVLAEKGLLKAKDRGKARTGKTIREYTLTLNGLVEILKDAQAYGHLDRLASVNEELMPEYFRLWPMFVRCGLDGIAAKILAYTVEKLLRGLPGVPATINGRKATLRDWLPRSAIYPFEAQVDGAITKEEAVKFVSGIVVDDEAASFYDETLQWVVDGFRSAKESFELYLNSFRQLRKNFEASRRLYDLLRTDKSPKEKLELIRKDPELAHEFVEMYPEAKNAKDTNDMLKLIGRIDVTKPPSTT